MAEVADGPGRGVLITVFACKVFFTTLDACAQADYRFVAAFDFHVVKVTQAQCPRAPTRSLIQHDSH